jgi:hypothetical protein
MIRERCTFFRGCGTRASSASTVSDNSGRSRSGDLADVKGVSGIMGCDWGASFLVKEAEVISPLLLSRRGG